MPIAASDIQLRRAGASSLGGEIATVSAPGFGALLPAESAAGATKYRCEYVRNGHSTETLTAAKIWLSANTPSPSTVIEIGLGTSAVGGIEPTVASETTAPVGVTFSAAATEEAAIALGDLAPGQSRAVWLRLTATAGAAALLDTYERTVKGEGPQAATVQSLWTGVPKTDGAVISAKMNSADTANSSRVAVSLASNLSSPVYSAIVAPDATYRVAKHVLSGLQPNTEYFYGVEVDGVLDAATTGRFKTLPAAGAANFSIVLGGCATNTDDAAFAAINALNPKPLFLVALGDFQYMEIASPTTANYHAAFDTSLARTVRKVTHSQIPTVYTWDDHDFGTDNSTGRDASNVARSFRATGLQFFRDRVPAITASSVATDTAHYSFVVGRVRFVVSDLRSDKTMQSATDNVNKTMMGASQKAWFKAEIAAAKAAGQVAAWINSVPWVVSTTAGADDWGGYTTERAELSDYIKAQAMTGKVFILSADMHALAIHAGADYATGGGGAIPVFHAGPFNRNSSSKGGPYTFGPYPSAGASVWVTQYGVMNVADNGTELTVTWSGYSSDGTLRMTHSFTPITAAPVLSAPAKMAAPTATAGNAQASITLVAPNNGGSAITGYNVSSTPAGGIDAVAGTTALNRTITGLQNGTSYQFSATATNAVGTSVASDLSASVTPAVPAASTFQATGGTITEPGDGYRYWTFTADGSLVVSQAGDVEYALIDGGGGGSSGGTSAGGPGGAGGVDRGTMTIAAGTYAMVIGQGGAGAAAGGTGSNGTASSIGALKSGIGGGRGGSGTANVANTGGSGGGGAGASAVGAASTAGGAGTAGKGNAGGRGYESATQAQRASGGGGGAGSAGADAALGVAGLGGEGVDVWGVRRAGGGGGSAQSGTNGLGRDGGGNGSHTSAGGNATPNTGAGGGGATNSNLGGAGGSGIVILRRAI